MHIKRFSLLFLGNKCNREFLVRFVLKKKFCTSIPLNYTRYYIYKTNRPNCWNVPGYFTRYCIPKRKFSAFQNVDSPNEAGLRLANKIIATQPDDLIICQEDLVMCCNFLLSHGFNESNILMCYQKFPHSKDLYLKAKALTEMGVLLITSMPLIKLSLTTLELATKRYKEDKTLTNFPNRFAYLCYHLQVEHVQLVNFLSQHSSVLTMEFSKLDEKMTLLKSAKIDTRDIVKNLQIFDYDGKYLSNRIWKAQKVELPIKVWLLRCPEKYFANSLSKFEQTKSILNGKDATSYLISKLNCSNEYLKVITEKNEFLTKVNATKLDKVINFLYKKGYTPEELCLFPRVFCSSVKTLNKRFEDFYSVKGTIPTLSQLCVSPKTHNLSKNRASVVSCDLKN